MTNVNRDIFFVIKITFSMVFLFFFSFFSTDGHRGAFSSVFGPLKNYFYETSTFCEDE